MQTAKLKINVLLVLPIVLFIKKGRDFSIKLRFAIALLPAAPRNCPRKFIQTPNKVEVEVEVNFLNESMYRFT